MKKRRFMLTIVLFSALILSSCAFDKQKSIELPKSNVTSPILNSDIMNALSELYYVTTSELSPLSDSDIISKIDSDKPFHMAWIDYENYKGHATTCRGYNDTGSVMTVSVMDTSYGTFSTKTKNSNGEFIYKMGTYSLPWDSSVVPD